MKVVRLFTVFSLSFSLQLFAGDAEDHGSGGMNPTESSSEEVSGQGLRVLFVGNSITLHSPYVDIGWYGNWGMAASCVEKDYVHLVVGALSSARQVPVDYKVKNLAAFEQNLSGYDLDAKLATEIAWKPEIVVIALGENVPDLMTDGEKELFQSKMEALAGKFKVGNTPIIVMRGTFWSNPVKNSLIQAAASSVGAAFVSTSDLGDADENKAIGQFAHSGIQGHPGDLGMQRIADRILTAIDPAYSGRAAVRAKEVTAIYAGHETTVGVAVDAAARQDAPVSVAESGTILKTGSGEWTLPLGAFDAWNPQIVAVKDGNVVLDLDDHMRREAAVPNQIISKKALFWFDTTLLAARPGLVETESKDGKTYVNAMYDVREINLTAETRKFPRAVAEHVFQYVKEGRTGGKSSDCATKTDADLVPSPELVTRKEKKAMWFGGVGSGRRMAIHRVGKTVVDTTADVRHVFAVQDVEAGWGNAFSPGFHATGSWIGSPESSLSSSILHVEDGAKVSGSRAYLNGVRKDPLQDMPVTGFSVFECELTATQVSVQRLFANEDITNGSSYDLVDETTRATRYQRGGGDYVYELICFTNQLTASERQAVVDYLKRKWTKQSHPKVEIVAADGVTNVIRSSTCATSVIERAYASCIVKRGAGDLVFAKDISDVSVQRGATVLAEDAGKLVLERPVPLEVSPGERVSAAFTDAAIELSKDNGAAVDEFVKDGRADLTVRSVPESAKRIRINGGRLIVRPIAASAANWLGAKGGDTRIEIPNHSFELRNSGDETKNYLEVGTYHGWTSVGLGDYASCQWIYDVDQWGLGEAGRDGATRSTWGLTARPHDGSSALMLGMAGGVKTVEPLQLAAGTYELEYWTNTRGANLGGLMDVLLISGGTRRLLGRQVQMYTAAEGFGRNLLRFTLNEAGSWQLGFKVNSWNSTACVTVIDDIGLRRVADRTDGTEWPVPGGDFEAVDTPMKSYMNSRTFSTSITHSSWTLQQSGSESATGTDLGVGYANVFMLQTYSGAAPVYNDSRYPVRSNVMTFFGSGSTASTTFTPPKGTWCVKGDFCENGQGSDGTVSAHVTIGGVETALGSIKPGRHLFATRRFEGGTFAVDGSTPVTLKLTFAASVLGSGLKRSAIYVDDLVLSQKITDVPAAVTVKSRWNFENYDLGTDCRGSAPGSSCGAVNYADYSSYGRDPCGGKVGMYLNRQGGYCRNYNLGKAGTYRLSLYVNRCSGKTGINPLRVWIAKAGASGPVPTNTVAIIRGGTYAQTEYSCDFRIPVEPTGNYWYTLGVNGTLTGDIDEAGETAGPIVVDNVTLAQVDGRELVDETQVFADDAVIEVAKGATLDLSFVGTDTIQKIKLGGKGIKGEVSAQTHPDYITGPGKLFATGSGLGAVLIVR